MYLNLPEQLRPKSAGLTDFEYQVYQDFENVPDYFLNEVEANKPQMNFSNDSFEEIITKL